MALPQEIKKAIGKAISSRGNKQKLEKELRAIYFLGLRNNLEVRGGILESIEKVTGMPLSKLAEKSNSEMVDLRCIIYFALKDHYGYSEIGRIFNKNHATIIHSVKRFENLYLYEREFRNKANKLLKAIKDENKKLRELFVVGESDN